MHKPADPTPDLFEEPTATTAPEAHAEAAPLEDTPFDDDLFDPTDALPDDFPADSGENDDGDGSNDGDIPPPPAPPVPPYADPNLPDLARYAERAYLEYAMSVVTGRALPSVTDGQKPVQRRILYAMNEMRLGPTTKHVKSARVVGEVLGKYHPHGDQAAYDAMVRMAQDFTLRYPLIDGQGNFGSRDGDGAAAMRYTESRLTPIAELLLSELDLGTVDWAKNYDGTFEEPLTLPARLPMVLMNGASGIAVGMATEIPSHNLRELAEACVALIDDPNLTTTGLMQYVQGPDFPGGGQLISSRDAIANAYETGYSKQLRVRAVWEKEDLARGQWRIVVKQLPPGVSAARVFQEIEDGLNPKVRPGKKTLTPEQQNLKTLLASVLDTMRDESDEASPVRMVFEPKSRTVEVDQLIAVLLAHTSLEANVPFNLVMLSADGNPRQKNLREILSEWIAYRIETVTRRTRHRLDAVNRRLHILEGRMIAFLHIDEVIRIIREEDDPKATLMARFGLSDQQTEDILEIRLRQLARIEGFRIEQEAAQLKEEAAGLQHLLDHDGAMRTLVAKEIRADASKYGDARRTRIEPVERVEMSRSNLIADEPVTIIVSKKGWIRARTGYNVDPATLTFKEGDALLACLPTRTIHPVILLDHQGRAYTISASDIPGGKGDGVPLTTFVQLQDGGKVITALTGTPTDRYLCASSEGYGFITTVEAMTARNKAGKALVTVDEGYTALPPLLVRPELTELACAGGGRLTVFPLSEVKAMDKGKGVKLIQLADNERLLAILPVGEDALEVPRPGRTGAMQTVKVSLNKLDAFRSEVRAKKGKPL